MLAQFNKMLSRFLRALFQFDSTKQYGMRDHTSPTHLDKIRSIGKQHYLISVLCNQI